MGTVLWLLVGALALYLLIRILRRAGDAPPAPTIAPVAGDDALLETATGLPDGSIMHVEARLFAPEGRVRYRQEVVGESHYQRQLERQARTGMRSGIHCVLSPDPDNPHDPNAVSVWCGGGLCGHLPRRDAARLHARIAELERREEAKVAVLGQLIGGGPGRYWGLVLCLPREVDPEAPPS